MKDNVFDIATDLLKERLNLAMTELHGRFKGTRPYRKEPTSPGESLYWYNQMDENMITQLRQQLGNKIVDDYITKMESLKRRYGHGK